MNSNFDVLVAESNENDGRINTQAQQISSLNSVVGVKEYEFLVYTTNAFVADNSANLRASLIALNNFCLLDGLSGELSCTQSDGNVNHILVCVRPSAT